MKQKIDMNSSIIRSGEIYLLTQTWSGYQYSLGPFSVLPGDGIRFIKQDKSNIIDDNNLSKSYGFVTINGNTGFQLVATNQNQGVMVSRYMMDEYKVESSLWQRLSHDQILTKYWAVFAVLLSIQSFLNNVLSKK